MSSQNITYVLLPRDFLRGLFSVYGMDLPIFFTGTGPDLRNLYPGDNIASDINLSTIAYLGEFFLAPLTFFAPIRALQ